LNSYLLWLEFTHIALNGTACPSYHLNSEVSKTVKFQSCSTSYTAVQIEKLLYNQSTVNTVKIQLISVAKGSHHVTSWNRHIWLSAKIQRKTLVSSWRMHCTYCGMPKSIPFRLKWYETVKKIKPAILELCWSGGIRKLVN